MGRHGRAGGRYVTPINSSGVELVNEGPRGAFTLTAGQTYHYILGGADAPINSVTITGYAASAVITSGTIMDTNHESNEVLDHSAVAGEWCTEDPSTAFVAVDGTGWSHTNGVIAASGAGVGGATFHIVDTGAARTRLTLAVGATGGAFRVSAHGKD